MRQYKLVFWDFDGVIKDSVLAKTNAFRLLFKEHPPELIEQICEHHRTHGGLSRFKKIPLYLEQLGISTCDKNIKIYCDRYAELVVEAVMSSAWVPGAKEYLSLNPHKQTFVLTSATPQLEIEQITKKLKIFDRFKSVYGSPTLKSQAIMQELNLDPRLLNFSVMVGDSIEDKTAASESGIDFIARIHALNADLFDTSIDRVLSDFYDQLPNPTN